MQSYIHTPSNLHTHGAGPNRQRADWSRLTGSTLFTRPRVSREDPNVKNMWLVFNVSGASVNTAAQEHRGQSGLESTSDLWDYLSIWSEPVWWSLRQPPTNAVCKTTNTCTHKLERCPSCIPASTVWSRSKCWAFVLSFCRNKTELSSRNRIRDAPES